jgi:glycosyltransferase involved in cell wall biosynthesis
VGSGDRSRVAIVIVTRDRCATLLKSLEHLAALPDGHRIVVVDNGSTDDTRQAVSRRHQVFGERDRWAATSNAGSLAG